MAEERKMVCVSVYEDGTWDICFEKPDMVTRKLSCCKPGTNVDGLCYICEEDMRYVYLKRLIKEVQSNILAKIATMQIASSNLQKIELEADIKEIRRQAHVRDGRTLEELEEVE